jgi:ATP-dependent RNA helicase DDX18/HAS1
VCPADKRFLLLFTFLKRNLKKKVMVFLSSCNSVKFHSELLNYIDIPVLDIHVSWDTPLLIAKLIAWCLLSQGKQKQGKRTTTFFEFCNAESGILVCTDGTLSCNTPTSLMELTHVCHSGGTRPGHS